MKKCLLSVVVLLLVSASMGYAQVTLPTWPQKFSIAAGEWQSFGIPVTQAGTITIDVTWTGCPIEITLRNGARRVVAQSGPKSPGKAQLAYNATVTDVAAGMLWSFSIRDARPAAPTGLSLTTSARSPDQPSAAAAASGTVSVQYPDIDVAAVQAQVAAVKSRLPSEITLAQTNLSKLAAQRFQQQEQQATQARLAANTAMATQLKSKLQGPILPITREMLGTRPPINTTAIAPGTTTTGTPMITTAPTTITATGTRLPTAATLGSSGKPWISKVTPNVGYYLDKVTISAQYITPFANSVETWFVFNDTIKVQTKVLNVTKTTDGISIETAVPTVPAGTTVNKTSIYVVAVDQDPAVTTNSLPFDYQQTVAPRVISLDKTKLGPSEYLKITGDYFKANSKVVYSAAGQEQVRTPYRITATTVETYTPGFDLAQSTNGQLWVTTDTAATATHPAQTLKSNVMNIAYHPTIPKVTSLDKQEAQPGESVLITGTGFYRPYIHWEMDPGQNVKTYNSRTTNDWKIISYTETGIVAQMPDNLGGVADTANGKLYIQNMYGGHITTPFRFKPLIIVKPLIRAEMGYTSFRQHEADDKYRKSGVSSWAWAMHCSNFFTGHRGDEYFKARVALINGWVPDHLEVIGDNQGNKGCRAVAAAVDPSGGFVYGSMHWWVDAPLDFTMYYFTIYIRGPQGVPYMSPYSSCEF